MKVYIVEDSAVLRERMIESLAESGNARIVGAADTEDDAISGILDAAPDAVILDIQLREGNGLNVLKRLRSIEMAVRPLIIILTNYNYPEFRCRAMSAGTDYFCDKATELHRVAEIISTLASPATVH